MDTGAFFFFVVASIFYREKVSAVPSLVDNEVQFCQQLTKLFTFLYRFRPPDTKNLVYFDELLNHVEIHVKPAFPSITSNIVVDIAHLGTQSMASSSCQAIESSPRCDSDPGITVGRLHTSTLAQAELIKSIRNRSSPCPRSMFVCSA